MCLSVVEQTFSVPNKKKGTGYKVGYLSKGRQVFYSPYFKRAIRVGRWVKDEANFDIDFIDSTICYAYDTGFHIYKNKKDTKSLGLNIVVKVSYRNVTAEGKQSRTDVGKCVVAREIFIHPYKEE